MYLRFVVGTEQQTPRRLTGVFVEAYALLNSDELAPYESDWLIEHLSWFEHQLPVPPYRWSRWSRWSPRATCWFRDTATSMVSRLRDLMFLLEHHNRPTRMLKTRSPGLRLYEDRISDRGCLTPIRAEAVLIFGQPTRRAGKSVSRTVRTLSFHHVRSRLSFSLQRPSTRRVCPGRAASNGWLGQAEHQ